MQSGLAGSKALVVEDLELEVDVGLLVFGSRWKVATLKLMKIVWPTRPVVSAEMRPSMS